MAGRGSEQLPLFVSRGLDPSQRDRWDGPRPLSALEAADELILEADAEDSAGTQEVLNREGALEPGQKLDALLDAETLQLLEKKEQQLGLHGPAFRRLKPWLIALNITVLELRSSGFSAELGVDSILRRAAVRRGLAVGFLETPAAQVEIFSRMPMEIQVEFLRGVLSNEDDEAEMARLVDAYRRADDARLAEYTVGSFSDDELRDRIFTDRNYVFAQGITEQLADEPTELVVVGAGHTVGPDNVPALLRAKGLRVQRLEAKGIVPTPYEDIVGASSWVPVRDDDLGFSAEFLGAPDVSPLRVQPNGAGLRHVSNLSVVSLILDAVSFPHDAARVLREHAEEIFDAGAQSLVQTEGAKLVESAPLEVEGGVGRSLEFELPTGKLYTRTYIRGHRTYELRVAITGRPAAEDPRFETRDRFFRSFAITDVKSDYD
ncbi:MAG: TraB/GumN family protein [Myxococcales bacterium]|nr:TraB/GumN family protein [Myxococcales bacterium]